MVERSCHAPFSAERLALLGAPVWWMVLARAPMGFCGLDRSAIASGISGFVSVACLLTLRHRLRGTRWRSWMNAALAIAWLNLLLWPAGFLVTLPPGFTVAVGLLYYAPVAIAAHVCADAALEAHEWRAARAMSRALLSCVTCWPLLIALLFSRGTIGGGQRQSSELLFVACAILACLPYVLVLVGTSSMKVRPRVSSDCLKCGYSLAGLADKVCPECGAPPQPEQAFARPSVREPLPLSQIAAGLVCVQLVTLAAYFVSPDNRLEAYKPLFLLEREIELGPHAFSSWSAYGGEDRAETPPMREYLRRADAGLIIGADAHDLADRILARHADPSAPLYLWPEVFSTLDGQRLITQAQHDRFVAQMEKWSLQLPPSVAEGEHFSFAIQTTVRTCMQRPELKHAMNYPTYLVPRLIGAWIDGEPIPCPNRIFDQQSSGGSLFSAGQPLPRVPAGTGKRRVRLQIDRKGWDDAPGEDPAARPAPIFLEGDINVTAGNPNPVGIVTDPAAIGPLLEKWRWTYTSGDHDSIAIQVEAPPGEPALPFSIVAELDAEFNGKRYRAGRFVLKQGARALNVSTYHCWRPAGRPKLKLTLRTTPDAAACEPGVTSAWCGPEFGIAAELRDQAAPSTP
jgi:hypothetical protein